MTKSTITREQLEEWVAQFDEDGSCDATDRQLEALIRQSLAAMAGEPLAVCIVEDGQMCPDGFGECDHSLPDGTHELFAAPQPAPVVPDAATAIRACLSEFPESARDIVEECADIAENACRATMLQAGNSPTQSDCCPAQNSASPAQDGNSPATSDNWQVEAEKLAEMHGMSFVLFRHGEAPQCADPTKVVISFTDKGLGHDALPAAPQGVIHG
ncbi:TPA: hypothetical protein OT989_000056 [Klebsiella pneumoniae]|uniref:hypothetical protein n=1 Tax=Klebsiella pneumoniae TaxID=573 RepID=UPI001AD8879E|nr:hypothetical protein [Klebsiella pneumoniae]EKY0545155.1 hypothetical protein [Klebsiella pneumoniae]MBO8077294.1 hypothetical protein [Klebsiella pneumoniae]HCT3297801.1 hypothetical protein [Klebsiella pneumoniae]HCT3715819.1 hypothetical protein [Klebsiella pneumoniae]HCT8409627.1 hypothetical protein [Klebsiella pneumoniae]